MPSPENTRLAVLIDAENCPAKYIEVLLEQAALIGVPTVKRAYGDWTSDQLSGWRKQVSGHAIQPMLQLPNSRGKNASDSALIIDAMDLLYSGSVDAFAIVSSDSDFTSLAIRLRASGKGVYGLGERKTPGALTNAVDRFIYLDDIETEEDVESKTSDDPAPRIKHVGRFLTRQVANIASDDWVSLSALGNHIIRVAPSFSVQDYGSTKLVDLVRAQESLEVEQNSTGPVRVRVRPTPTTKVTKKAPARKATAKKS